MTISAVTVSVNYADLLANSIDRWLAGVEKLLVVTTPHDFDTIDLCAKRDVLVHLTEAFYYKDCAFNKGAGISEAVAALDYLDDWCLFFDADIIPPPRWRGVVETSGIRPGNIYGARRIMENGSKNHSDDYELAGYFQLFHATDTNAQRRPLLDCSWRHAGGVDSEFQARWPRNHKHYLPLTLLHQGEPGRNWFGRHNIEAMDRLVEDRRRNGRIMNYERLEEVRLQGPQPT